MTDIELRDVSVLILTGIDTTLARLNEVIAKLDALQETQRDHTARLNAIEARLARLEARAGLVE